MSYWIRVRVKMIKAKAKMTIQMRLKFPIHKDRMIKKKNQKTRKRKNNPKLYKSTQRKLITTYSSIEYGPEFVIEIVLIWQQVLYGHK